MPFEESNPPKRQEHYVHHGSLPGAVVVMVASFLAQLLVVVEEVLVQGLLPCTRQVDATESEPKSFIFMSEDALINPDKLLVLIHGNGVVRAGQWARRLIINEDLDSGTQIPYIKRAIGEGYGVIVLNPNENYIEVEKTKAQIQLSSDCSDEPAEKRERKDKIQKETKKRRDFYEKYRNPQKEKETMQIYIRDNGSPEEHAIYVWDHFISQSAAENVFFVAHSYGGLAFVELMIQREAEVKNKVTAVALTDSVHNVWHQEVGKTIREWMRENCCNWVSSSEPLDTSVESMLPDCPRISADIQMHGPQHGTKLPELPGCWFPQLHKGKIRKGANLIFTVPCPLSFHSFLAQRWSCRLSVCLPADLEKQF
ncbi:cotranscriptional regulator FAM172A isoform X4 [Myiozetetes cayanensis]|uniref:cotranscriptional regulator FAM172A isoform X4 n=1 Tax=Myiozetetes cayanensis TaxID=478635 RepID=UPI00215E4916|nr:cotranscriptional regulator FAM172A isoform X4 [Myiozetetes cayanensis]